jgi:hypothetical protein
MAYNRYVNFVSNGTWSKVPFVPIPKKNTDIYDYYTNTRLDILSYKYYGDANYGWLILQANPELGSLEYNIPQHTLLRIPYPLDITLSQYDEYVKNYETLYGLK